MRVCVQRVIIARIIITDLAGVCACVRARLCVFVQRFVCVRVCGVCVENKAVADNVSIVAGALRPSLSQGPQG